MNEIFIPYNIFILIVVENKPAYFAGMNQEH